MTKVKSKVEAPKHDVTTLRGWRAQHASCGRGPWRDSDIHVYRIWRCACGATFKFSKTDEETNPARYAA